VDPRPPDGAPKIGGLCGQVQTLLREAKERERGLDPEKEDLQCQLDKPHSRAGVEAAAGAEKARI